MSLIYFTTKGDVNNDYIFFNFSFFFFFGVRVKRLSRVGRENGYVEDWVKESRSSFDLDK